MKMTEVDKDMSGGGRKKALCMTAGVAAAVLGTVGALLAVACGIALFIWGVSNYGQEIGSVMTAVVAGASAGALAAIPSAILAIVSWYLMGEPISRRCRERAGVARDEQRGTPRSNKKAPGIGTSTGAATGIAGMFIFLAATQGSGMSMQSATALSGVILGAAAGVGLGIGVAVNLIRDEMT